MTYQEALDFLYTQLPVFQKIGKKAFNKDLTKTLKLCSFLDNPENGFKSIHVAGTNGKGSTAHMLASVLQESDLKVGLYTSPHLKTFRERIRVNGELLEERFVADFVQRIQPVISEIQPSFFEITVAMAFEYFAEKEVDIAVVETGLGGRLDSTNVIAPILSVITSIGLDHTDILGDTMEAIAFEKAGIIKPKVPVVIGDLNLEAQKVIEEVALKKKANLFQAEGSISVESDLKGESFNKNVSKVLTSLSVLKQQGYSFTADEVRSGLQSVCKNTGLKGRWQTLSTQPLTICDIGHNVEAVQGLVLEMKKLEKKNMHIVWGMVKEKAVSEVLRLLPKEAHYYFCAAKIDRSMPANDLTEMARSEGLDGKCFTSVSAAIESASGLADSDDLVFIGGSTFVVAEIEDL